MTRVALRRDAAAPMRYRRDACVAAALALLVQLPLLGLPSYWKDEAATLSAARRPVGGLVDLLHHTDVVHGAYYLLMHVWTSVGTAEWWVRLPSALCFAGTVGLVTATAGALHGRRAAVIAAVVAGWLPGLTWTAVDARPSAAAALLATASMTLLLRPSTAHVGRSALCWLAAALLQLTALLLAPAWLVAARRAGRARTVAGLAAVGVLAAPLAYAAHTQDAQLSWIRVSTVGALRSALLYQPVDGARGDLLGGAAPWLRDVLAVATVLLALGYAVVVRDWCLPLWAYAPGVLAALAVPAGTHVYLARYFAFSAPAFALMAAALAARVPARRWSRVPLAAAVLVACAVPLWLAQRTPTGHWHENLRADADVIARARGAAVVYVDASGRAVALAYPDAVAGRVQAPAAGTDDTLWGRQLTVGEAAAIARAHPSVVLVGTRNSRRLPAVVRASGCRVLDERAEHRFATVRLAC